MIDSFYDDLFDNGSNNQNKDIVDESTFEMLCAITDAYSTKEMINYLLLESKYQLDDNLITLEDATSESLKAIFGSDMKDVKNRLNNVRRLIREGKRSEARKELIDVRSSFVKIHEKVAKVKQGPISFFTSAILSVGMGPYMAFANISNDLELNISSRLISKGTITAMVNILAISGVKMPVVLASYFSGLGIGQQFGTMLVNKFHKLDKNSKGEKLSHKAGAFNDIQRDVLYIIKLYIENCDRILEKI